MSDLLNAYNDCISVLCLGICNPGEDIVYQTCYMRVVERPVGSKRMIWIVHKTLSSKTTYRMAALAAANASVTLGLPIVDEIVHGEELEEKQTPQ